MKLASLRAPLLSLSLALVPLALPSRALADTAEARAAVMLRERPANNGKVVERLPAGTRLNIVEMSEDGAWAKVRGKSGHEGWVPVASLRTRQEEEPRPDDEALAKRRNVRPESWVSKSKYHEDDNKMTVTASKAELYGRPQASGTVLGIVRRGEVVQFVRKSADKKWVQIDIGAGELAWVDAKAVRMGADMDRSDDPPDEPRRPTAREERRDPPREERREPPREERREPPREEPRRRVEPGREPSPEDLRRADRARDDEPPPGGKTRREEPQPEEPRRRAEPRVEAREDDRRDEPEPPRRRRRETQDRERPETRSTRPKRAPHGPNYLDARVKIGFAKLGSVTRTNGSSTTLLRSYEHSTTNIAIGAQLGYSRAWGKLRLHADLKYLVAALGSVVYRQTDTISTQLQVFDQNIGGGLALGGFFDVAGGIDLRLRLGADAWVNQISPSNPPLSVSSDIVLGMAIGVEFAMPEPVLIAGRPLGFRLKLGAIAPATRIQQPNLKTAPQNSTLGGYAGVSVHMGLFNAPKRGQLHLELGYDFAFHFTKFSGSCPPTTDDASRVCRDDTVDDANQNSSAHVGAIGLYYQY